MAVQQAYLVRLLFIDFDGVLHPGLAGTFVYIDRLESFLRQHPQVLPVPSTSWRLTHDLEQQRTLFASAVRGRILSVTLALPDGTPGQREAEIRRWRADNGLQRAPLATLDDDASLFSGWCEHLVARGLSQQHLARVRELLRL
jgi:hypothetical protein